MEVSHSSLSLTELNQVSFSNRNRCEPTFHIFIFLLRSNVNIYHIWQRASLLLGEFSRSNLSRKKGSWRSNKNKTFQQSPVSSCRNKYCDRSKGAKKFATFENLLHNYWANFNQTCPKTSLGEGNSNIFKWRVTFLSKGDNYDAANTNIVYFQVFLFPIINHR